MIKETSYSLLKDNNIKKSDNPFCRYIAYYLDKKVIGFIEYNDIYESIDIVNVFVKEEYRNKKIGTKLLSYLIEKSKDKYNITLEVNINNSVAIHLYEKLGFKKVSLRKGYYKGIDAYLMELTLGGN